MVNALGLVIGYLRDYPEERARIERFASETGVPVATVIYRTAAALQAKINAEIEHELLYGRPGAEEPWGIINAEE